jgi:predicted metalloendopeptidase
MSFTLRFLPRNAALLALGPLTAHSQDAPAPETHGIVVADIDRSVKPGADFYDYANGDWLMRTQLPANRWTHAEEVNEALLKFLAKPSAKGQTTATRRKAVA